MTRPKQRNFKYTVREPKWSAADRSSIDCLVKFEHMRNEEPFTASPNDSEPHGREIYRRLVAGEFGDIAPFEAPPPRPLLPAEVLAAFNAFWKTRQGEKLARRTAQHNKEIASGSSRAIAAQAEAILSAQLRELLCGDGVPSDEAKKMRFFRKIEEAVKRGLISAKERAALDLIRQIRNEVAHEEDGTFYTDEVCSLTKDLHSCLADYTVYQPPASIDDKWIDLLFIEAFTIISMSLEARANPECARTVS